jgi:hypothetical protein
VACLAEPHEQINKYLYSAAGIRGPLKFRGPVRSITSILSIDGPGSLRHACTCSRTLAAGSMQLRPGVEERVDEACFVVPKHVD